MPIQFFHTEDCTCGGCSAPTQVMSHPTPDLRLVGVEMEIAGLSQYEIEVTVNSLSSRYKVVPDGSIPNINGERGGEVVSAPFKTDAGFEKAVEILEALVRNGGCSGYEGQKIHECDYCQGECSCDYCRGYCSCDYCTIMPQDHPDFPEYCEGECCGECEGECECSRWTLEGSTGFHVHVDARDIRAEWQRNLIFAVYMFHWTEIGRWHHFSRQGEGNEFSLPAEFPYYFNDITLGDKNWPYTSRYYAVNHYHAWLKHGTIEFRQGFLPDENPEFVALWAKWCRAFVETCSELFGILGPKTTIRELRQTLATEGFSLGNPWKGEFPSFRPITEVTEERTCAFESLLKPEARWLLAV